MALLLTAYDLGRGAAPHLGIGVSSALAPRADAVLLGHVPTVWLQQHLYAGGFTHWWDVPVSLVYLSHFFVPFAILASLWVRSRPMFLRFRRRFVAATWVALFVFVVHPEAPPWLAAGPLHLGHVTRTALFGFEPVHLHAAAASIGHEAARQNLVAAFPSLHATYPALLLFFFWRQASGPLRAVLAVYALSMGFTLIATGEHWFVDILGGWMLAASVCAAFTGFERRCIRPNGFDSRVSIAGIGRWWRQASLKRSSLVQVLIERAGAFRAGTHGARDR